MYHPSFKFADDVFYKFKPEDKQRLFDDRASYKRSRQAQSVSQYYQPQMMMPYSYPPPQQDLNMQIGQVSLPPLPSATPIQPSSMIPPPPSPRTVSSTVSVPGSIMGGRNAQMGNRHYQGGHPS